MSEQEPKKVTAYEMLEAMPLAFSPDDYEEVFHNFTEDIAEHTMEVAGGGVFLDHEGTIHSLLQGDYVSIKTSKAASSSSPKTLMSLADMRARSRVYARHMSIISLQNTFDQESLKHLLRFAVSILI